MLTWTLHPIRAVVWRGGRLLVVSALFTVCLALGDIAAGVTCCGWMVESYRVYGKIDIILTLSRNFPSSTPPHTRRATRSTSTYCSC